MHKETGVGNGEWRLSVSRDKPESHGAEAGLVRWAKTLWIFLRKQVVGGNSLRTPFTCSFQTEETGLLSFS